jgi:hypothetical protein
MSVDDERVAADDERRLRQHEQVKGEVRAEVNRELRVEAVQQTAGDANQAADVAKHMKDRAFREVSSSEATLTRARRLRSGLRRSSTTPSTCSMRRSPW